MIFRRPRFKILFLLSLLVLISAGAGFFVGIALSSAINKKKDNPVFWKQAAMKQLGKLKPSEEQRKKFELRTDSAVQELTALRKEAIKDVWQIVDRALLDIDKELTPQQRETFIKIKPKAPPEAK
jgi:hypothetical protein